jgi:hypothetical protein
MNSKTNWTRRQVLRGTGVAIALPWLETFAPRKAYAQSVKKRFMTLYFPNGTAEFWRPTGEGAGAAWKLSPILEPLLPVKKYLTVLSGINNTAPFGGNRSPGPQHATLAATTFTGVKPTGTTNGISIDQVIAKLIKGPSLPSLEVGLSTLDSYTDGLPAPHSRSMSWASATQPLYKVVNPQAVFDRLFVDGPKPPSNMMPVNDPDTMKRKALKQSVLDFVIEGSKKLQTQLSRSDRVKADEFLTSVRDLETRVKNESMQVGPQAECKVGTRPPEPYAVRAVPANYSRENHSNIMIDLVVMAIQCDITRVVSFMLDDARSDFAYTFLKARNFTLAGSTEAAGNVSNGNIGTGLAGYHGLQHAGDTNNGFATIGYWNALKASQIAQRLAAIQEGDSNVLENSVIVFGSGMHGGNHRGDNIPIALLGSGGKVLKNDFNLLDLTAEMCNVHLTILQKVFGGTDQAFGASTGIMPSLLA